MRRLIITLLTGLLLLSAYKATQSTASLDEIEQPQRGIYIPKDLDDCFVQLKKLLKPADIEKMRVGTEGEMIHYHFSLGLWMRNNWGLWGGSRLAKWFNAQGINHPDDMSGIVLCSFWRHLNSKPIKLDEQVKYYKEYWKNVLEDEKREKERAKHAIQQVGKMMMGASLMPNQAPIVKMPQRKNPGLQARYLAAYRGGVLLTIRKDAENNFSTPGYFLELERKRIHPITIPEIEEVHFSVVVGNVAYFSGNNGTTPIIIALDRDSRSSLTLPPEKSVPQLGSDGVDVIAVYRDSIYVFKEKRWLEIYRSEIPLPKSGPPPRKIGNRVLFRDEGQGESQKRLWWLELTGKSRLISLDQDVGVVGPSGPRWENSFSYCTTPGGDIWATLGEGHTKKSLIKRSANGKYEIAIINNSVHFDKSLWGKEGRDDGLSVSAVAISNDATLLAAGDHGLYRIEGKRITQILVFENTTQQILINDGKNVHHWSWNPSDILELSQDNYIISGAFGGIYLIERDTTGAYSMLSLDESIGEPIAF